MIRKGLFWSMPLLALGWASGLWAVQRAEPGSVYPVHWNLSGEPDSWAGASQAFLASPAIATGLTVLLAAIPLIAQPLAHNLRRSEAVYLTAWLSAVALVVGLHLALVVSAFAGLPEDTQLMPRAAAVATSLVLVAVGNVLGKARRNWFIGVRTPWTLSSEQTWDRTHRLMAWVWTLGGLGLAAISAVGPIELVMIMLVGFALGSASLAFVYSWWVWRNADDRMASQE